MDADVARLEREAKEVLRRAQRNEYTCPDPELYPVQFSWDSAFMTMGYARYDTDRAMREMRSLFRGQWADGRVPHVVFDPHGGRGYEPGPDFWEGHRSPDAPDHVQTSTIVQPPVHASAVFNVWHLSEQGDEDRLFLSEMFPRLVRWHDYLHRTRDPHGDGLLAIRHPWESGRDNCPLWKRVYEGWDVPEEELAAAKVWRSPTVEDEGRPDDDDNRRYLYLVEQSKELDHDEDALREASPFLVQDAMFNAIMVRADHDLGRIAKALGRDDWQRFEDRSWRVTNKLNDELWDEEDKLYGSRDVRTGEVMNLQVAAAFVPLYANVPSKARAEAICRTLNSRSFCPLDDEECWAVPNYDREAPGYSPRNYWAGPLWLFTNWLLYDGLMRYRLQDYADRIRKAILELPAEAGFREYYAPDTGEGYGARNFAPSASFVVDVLNEERDEEGKLAGTAST